MNFMHQLPRFLFFTGKGGVGKTSIACATAIQLADAGHRVLLVSTDPASNVGQVFNMAVGYYVTAVPAVPNLHALEIDPQKAAAQYRERVVGSARGTVDEDDLRSIEEQLSGACTTEIAAFDEFTALLTDDTLTQQFDHVIFDTAPTGHTIRMLQLPGAWSQFLADGQGDASCLGPLAGLEKQQQQYQAAVQALSDPERTRMILVARPQASALREVARTHEELSAIGLKQSFLVLNGAFPESDAAHDELASAVYAREQTALKQQPSILNSLPTDRITLKPFNLVGLEALRQLLQYSSGAAEIASSDGEHPLHAPDLESLVDAMASSGKGLIMVMGKGGVGKTTMAAAIAVGLADRGLPVHLTTSDPAAHLQETLSESLDNLEVSRIDPQAETERYRQHVMSTKGSKLDKEGRALLEEDLRSPCTEEIAVFQAFSRIIRQAGKKFVVMDTAPTGHTLLLLDTTGAYHRDIERQMADKPLHFTTPLMQLQDPEKTSVLLVTLAETTPVLEAANLQDDLRRAGIEPRAWIINNSVAAARTGSPLLLKRAANECQEIDQVANKHARRYAVVPLLREEPVGLTNLRKILSIENGQ